MSTEITAALEKVAPKLAGTVPESANIVSPKSDYGAGEFWKDDTAPAKPAEKPAETKPTETEKPEETVEVSPLAKRFGVKTKGPVKAEVNPEKKDVAPKVEAAPEKAPEDEMDLDHRSSPIARQNFAKLKSISKENRARALKAEQERDSLNARIAELQKTPAAAVVNNEEVEGLKKQLKELSDWKLIHDTKNHPVFQKQYVEPRKEALANAQELLKANGKDGDLASLLERPRGELGKAIAELVKDLPPLDQTEISQNVLQAYKLRQQEQQALAQANEVNGSLRQNTAQEHEKAFDSTWNKSAAKFQELLQPVEIPANFSAQQKADLEAYNESIKSLQSNAKKIATGASSYEAVSEAAIKAATYDLHVQHVIPRLAAEMQSMLEVIQAQKKEIDGYRSRNPNREISATPNAPSKAAAPSTIEEAAAKAWG